MRQSCRVCLFFQVPLIMFGMPEPQPDHKAIPRFWAGLTKFIGFVAVTFSVVYGVQHVESKAHEAIVGN